jgi:hypothetical protein
MDDLSDRTAFLLDDLVRLDVARACETAARTKSQIGHELEREPGSLSAVVTLEKRGALVKAGRAPARGKRPGGEQWKLDPSWVPAVRTAEADAWAGRLSSGLDLILIPLPETKVVCDALAAGDAAAAWGIPLRGEQRRRGSDASIGRNAREAGRSRRSNTRRSRDAGARTAELGSDNRRYRPGAIDAYHHLRTARSVTASSGGSKRCMAALRAIQNPHSHTCTGVVQVCEAVGRSRIAPWPRLACAV